ncbi:MAG TPA: glycine zipper domain-containing protein [Candidatus Limnocylindrales bacterium]|nr:glycine zipper domain-containing protein [Candidatus Limnocylindrales bacterium]
MDKKSSIGIAALGLSVLMAVGCAGGPMTSREQGAGIGAVGGAAAGGLIGTAFGRPGMGAAIGAGTGLVGGALVGDYMQGQQQQQYNDQTIQQNQRTIERNRQDIQRPQRSEY